MLDTNVKLWDKILTITWINTNVKLQDKNHHKIDWYKCKVVGQLKIFILISGFPKPEIAHRRFSLEYGCDLMEKNARASCGLNYTCWWLSAPRDDYRGTIYLSLTFWWFGRNIKDRSPHCGTSSHSQWLGKIRVKSIRLLKPSSQPDRLVPQIGRVNLCKEYNLYVLYYLIMIRITVRPFEGATKLQLFVAVRFHSLVRIPCDVHPDNCE